MRMYRLASLRPIPCLGLTTISSACRVKIFQTLFFLVCPRMVSSPCLSQLMIDSTSSCNLMHHNIEWLKQHIEQYRLERNDVCEAVEDFGEIEKLGQGFTSADPLEEVDIGNGAVPRSTFVNKNVNADYKAKLIEFLREYVDCFTWSYSEMSSLSRELVEHRLLIKDGFRPYKQPAWRFNRDIYDRVKEEVNWLHEANFVQPCRYAIGSPTSFQLRRKAWVRYVFALIFII
jgi:hypothetical protein